MEPQPSRRAAAKAPAAGAFGAVVRQSEDELVLRHADFPDLVTRVPGYEGADTLSALFELSAARHGARPMLGTRAVLATQPSPGRGPAKSELGDFSWLSYQDAAESVISFGAGLRALGLPPRAVVALFADTSAHWLIAAHACFREGFTVATVYTSLGAAGVQQALAASDAAAVITDAAGAKVMAATDAASAAQRVILLPPRAAADDGAIAADAAVAREALPAATRSHTWREVVDAAPQANEMQRRAPEPADVALIMFTSGSTGTPKGVLLSHSAVVAAIAGILTWNQHAAATLKAVPGAAADVAAAAGPNDRALAYLPLAHIFEFVAEHAVCLAAGVPLGYGSPATLTDAAPGVARGSRGDAPALRATFLTAVPTVLERVRASVDGGLRALRGAKGAVARPAFGLAYAVGDAALRRCGVYGAGAIISSGPHAHTGGGCSLVARAASSLCASVFAAPRAALGGGVRFFLSGGAPLSPSTQRYLQIVFGCPVLQGYGLTETCCIGTLTSPADLALGRCGAPVPSGLIKLVPWADGGYSPADKPLPRGEVHIGGPALAAGYMNMEEATAADFYTDAHGERWFRTGDIGVVHPDGVLSIVDRRKDIVKLERGEFLSLGKVEAALQTEGALVAHALVVARGTMKAPAALVAPHMRALRDRLGNKAAEDDAALLRSEAAMKAVLDDLREAGRKSGLERWEVPVRVRLVAGPWTPESGLVTAALKVRRQSVQAAFKDDVDALLSP